MGKRTAKTLSSRLKLVESMLAEVLETVREIRQEQRVQAEAKALEIELGVEAVRSVEGN